MASSVLGDLLAGHPKMTGCELNDPANAERLVSFIAYFRPTDLMFDVQIGLRRPGLVAYYLSSRTGASYSPNFGLEIEACRLILGTFDAGK
jgi:hypothetical protein